MGIFSAIGGLFGGGSRTTEATTTSSSAINDNRIGVADQGVLLQAGATLDASTSSVTNDQDTTTITIQSGEALQVASDAVAASLEYGEAILSGALDQGRIASEIAERSALTAVEAVQATAVDSTAALERVTGASIDNAEELAALSIESNRGVLADVLAATGDQAAQVQSFAVDALAGAAAASRSDSAAVTTETLNTVKVIGLALAAAVAMGALK